MFNFPLFRREIKSSIKLLLIFGAVMTLYVSMIITMYDPELMKSLDEWVKIMPGLMAAVGMKAGATTLLGFMSSYLYGFVLLVCPMMFTVLRANALIARYADKGSLVTLLAAPVKRRAVAFTQMKVLASGMVILLVYATVLEIVCAAASFPGELDIQKLLWLNAGLLCLHLFIGGIAFFASCLFSDTKYSIGFGAGIPVLMFLLQMLANTGGAAKNFRYTTFFTLFNPDGLLAGETGAWFGVAALFTGALFFYTAAVIVFSKKDLHI